MAEAILYDYFRSSAAYRVRIALNLKGLSADRRFVHLLKGEQNEAAYRAVNPSGLLPYWTEGDFGLAQSLAILEYLDETHPQPPLLPTDPRARALVREVALTVCCDIHSIGNLRVLNKLKGLGIDEPTRIAWLRHWIGVGFTAIEARLATLPGPLAFGDAPTLADICLVPQMFNARRFGVDLAPYPRIAAADAAANAIEAFAAAAPARQPDAE